MEKLEWLSQVKKGLLEYSILKIISRKSIYGYDLLSILNDHEVLSTTEGTIYPLLRRLKKMVKLALFGKTVPLARHLEKYLQEVSCGLFNVSKEDLLIFLCLYGERLLYHRVYYNLC